MQINKETSKTKVSLVSAVFLSSTCMVGSGWLFSAQLNARLAGMWGFAAWVMAAFILLLVGLCYTVVAAKFPVRGATARSSALSHNHVFGMPFAFANWFGILMVIPNEAQATTQYLAGAIHSGWLMSDHKLTVYGKLVALFVLVIYLLINYFGIKVLSRINNIVTVFKVFTPLFLVAIFLIAAFGPSGQGNSNLVYFKGDYTISSAFMAVIGAGLIYSFNGFQICLSFASEIKNPKRNIPLAIILSIGVVLLLYMLLQYSFMTATPWKVINDMGGWQGMRLSSPLLQVAMMLGFNFVSILLVIDSVISPSGTGYTYLGAVTRMTSGMSKEKQLPGWLGKQNPVYHFSRRALLFNFIITLVVLWNADNWASLMVVVTGYHIIGYMAAPISMGAVSPGKRIFGVLVFIILGLILYTLEAEDFLKMNISLTLLLVIYGAVQFFWLGIKKILFYVAPMMIYLWLSYLLYNPYVSVILSVVFYFFITSPWYVAKCKRDVPSETSAVATKS